MAARDLIGYGEKPPIVHWPKHARLAINFILNYEEGAEMNVLNGDLQSENYLVDIPQVTSLVGQRHLSAESMFEYGSRVGIWRLLELFTEYKISLTIFAVGLALERNMPLARNLQLSTHEIAGHGYRWINYRDIAKNEEQIHIDKTMAILHKITGKNITGWYTGRCSQNTRELIVAAGLTYDSDSYADDLPYWVIVANKPHLIIPYSLETNDFRFSTCPGWNSCEDYYQNLKAAFDCLYREGKQHPKLLTIGIHPRLSGRPGRCEALRRFIEYIDKFNDIWICRREEIATFWYQHYLPAGKNHG